MKTAKEICREIESKVVTYGWWRVYEDVEKLLVEWQHDIQENERKKTGSLYVKHDTMVNISNGMFCG